MTYQKAKIGDLFDVQLLDSRKRKGHFSILEDESEKYSNPFSTLDKVGVVVEGYRCISVNFSDGDYLFSKKVLLLADGPKNNNLVLCKYVYYYLLANKDRLDKLYMALDQKIIPKILESFVVYYPSMAEQYEIVGKLDSIFNMMRFAEELLSIVKTFPSAFCLRMKQATGYLWNVEQLRNLASLSIKKDKASMNWSTKIEGRFIEMGGKIKLSINCLSDKCNPYFLASALSVKTLFRQLETERDINMVSLYKMNKCEIRIPTPPEQILVEEIYKSTEKLSVLLYDLIEKLQMIKLYYLTVFLYRKSFNPGQKKYTDKTLTKCLYTNSNFVDSIQSYDALRHEIYQSLRKGELEQYFDAVSNSVKLRKNETFKTIY